MVEMISMWLVERGVGLKGTKGPSLQGKRNIKGAGVPLYLSVVNMHQGGWRVP